MLSVMSQPSSKPAVCPGYQMGRQRGRGPTGTVWEAVGEDNAAVALKFLGSGDSQSIAQELRAMQIVSQLRHPNLTRIHRVWCQDHSIVVSMELADGNVAELLKIYRSESGGYMSIADACFFLDPVAAALDFLNSRQHQVGGRRVAIQHCNVQPSNLLVFGETVKLADYHLATVMAGPLQPLRWVGNLAYAAPEIFQGWLSERTDQFALAVTYYELRIGKLPFPELPAQIDPSYVRPAPDLAPLTAAERPILARALNRVVHERWPSCRELMAQLSRCQGKLAAAGRG